MGSVGNIGFDNLCGEEFTIVGCMVAEEQIHVGVFFNNDEHTTIGHQVYVGT